MDNMTGYHDTDVQFTEESLIAFIKSIHDNIGDNYHFVSPQDMLRQLPWRKITTTTNQEAYDYYDEQGNLIENNLDYNEYELEIAKAFPLDSVITYNGKTIPVDWYIDNIMKICIINQEVQSLINFNNYTLEYCSQHKNDYVFKQNRISGRYTWITVNELLHFKDEININTLGISIGSHTDPFTNNYENYLNNHFNNINDKRPVGTILVSQYKNSKFNCIQVKGFNDNGNFSNEDPSIGIEWNENAKDFIWVKTDNDQSTTGLWDRKRVYTDQLAAKMVGSSDVPIITGYFNNIGVEKMPVSNSWFGASTSSIQEHSSEGYGYIHLTHTGQLRITNKTDAARGADSFSVGEEIDNINNLAGSIITAGGIAAGKSIKGSTVHAAVFNDYAECRKTISLSPGHVVIDQDDGSLVCASARLQPGAQVISDTYGNLMGETSDCQTPIAVAGRVLVYPYQSRENYHAGMAVCSAPDGTVDIMTREEIRDYPDCIVGIVSEIPQYEKWGSNQVNVDGRIWIKVK